MPEGSASASAGSGGTSAPTALVPVPPVVSAGQGAAADMHRRWLRRKTLPPEMLLLLLITSHLSSQISVHGLYAPILSSLLLSWYTLEEVHRVTEESSSFCC